MGSARLLLAGSLLAAILGAGSATGASGTSAPTLKQCKKLVGGEVMKKGTLTVATNNPALWPWFVDNKPQNDKGYESQVAFQIGAALGFRHANVTWVDEPYEEAVQAGSKPFDFDVNEVIYTKALSARVDMSTAYFNVTESLVALKGNVVVKHHTPAELHKALFGALAGSPGLRFLERTLKPATPPVSYKTMTDAIDGLKNHQVDALVIDTPTGHYLVSEQLTSAVQFGQFLTTGTYYAAVLQHGNPLAACIDAAIKQVKDSRELANDSKADLKVYNSIPYLKP